VADKTRTTDEEMVEYRASHGQFRPNGSAGLEASTHELRTGLTDYFIRCQTKIRITFTPSRVVVLNVIVSWSPERVK
jgi:hypothetical protein